MSKKEINNLELLDPERVEKMVKLEKCRKHRRRRRLLFLLGGAAIAIRSATPTPTPGNGWVTLNDERPSPLSFMAKQMLRENLKNHKKKEIADKIRLSIALQDIDHKELATTLSFEGSDVTITSSVPEDVDVYIGFKFNLVPLLSGVGMGPETLNWLRSENGQKMIRELAGGGLKIRGVVRHPVQMVHLMRFMVPATGVSGGPNLGFRFPISRN